MKILLLLWLSLTATTLAKDKGEEKPPSIKEMTAGMQKHEGFFTYYWDAAEGKVWLEVVATEEEFLYINSLPRGVGSNDIGLDRGQFGNTRIVFFRRTGPKLLLIQPNYAFRALTDNVDEQAAVTESFAVSVLHGFEIAAENDGSILVDATSFFMRDARRVARSLRRTKQGAYKLDASRSVLHPDGMKNFPFNTVVSAMLTFTADSAGSQLRQVTPTPEIVTVVQRHSLVRLPDDDYRPRSFDLRAGYFGISFMDFATPIGEPITQRFIARHRLIKKNAEVEFSEPIEPIVYYVERSAPEPIRSALIEGASWWQEAFGAAGFTNAFQVRLLPAGVDPMDVRYNVIQWVHRASRGWSYGDAVIDPRTGEIIKGHITLGSLRARQDYLIAEGLLAPYSSPDVASPKMLEMALARIRQLAAHEVGHTLGLRHNFAASSHDRASVMDYPYPYVKIGEDGQVDLSEAYDAGIGEWDKAAIAYGYRQFSETTNDNDSSLTRLGEDYVSNDLQYASDADARSLGSANRSAHLWDNGTDPVDELDRIMDVRRHVLDRFSPSTLATGRPMALLEETLVPIYMFHRYQLEAAGKVIAGLSYGRDVKGLSFSPAFQSNRPVSPEDQRRALASLLRTIEPEALAFSEKIISWLPPATTGYRSSRENFKRRTGSAFDPLAAAESAANLTMRVIFHRHRAARLVEHHALDREQPGLEEIIDKTVAATWKTAHGEDYYGEIQRVVDNVVLHHLISLAADNDASRQVRAMAYAKLDELRKWLEKEVARTKKSGQHAHLLFAEAQINLFQDNPGDYQPYHPSAPPAGSPIGDESDATGRFGCLWR